MKVLRYLFIVILLLVLQAALPAQNISPQFSELKGMEDAQGNTNLFYRIYSYELLKPSGFYEDNSLYHLDLANQTDNLIIRESGSDISVHIYINDYKVINLNPIHYIYAATACGLECSPFAYNSDYGFIFDDGSWGNSYKIGYGQNSDLIYYGLTAWGMDSSLATLCSYDGGLNWDTLSSRKIFMSLNPYDNQSSFYLDGFTQGVFKSSDSGVTFYIADTTQIFINPVSPEFYYDPDQNHIYRNSVRGGYLYYLAVSFNKGEPFSWSNKYYSNSPIFFSNDTSQTGVIYLSEGKKIHRSIDYGNTFTLYKELNQNIIGIYKKPNSSKLYAASKYKIYEITDDTISVIKSLPIPEEILAFYPIAVGNKWIYYYLFVDWNSIGYQDIFVREVQSLEVKPNGKEYFKIREKYVQMGFESIVYERIDSIEGRVYRYDENCPNSEQFIEDLVMDVSDSTYAARFGYCIEHAETELLSEQHFNNWGIEGNRRNYRYVELVTADYFLSTDIGLDYFRLDDDNGWKDFALKGMLKNGIVYGDTTITDVEDENNLPKEYSLSQNYPNPFNPVTTIKYAIPNVISTEGRNLKVQVKVFDILGNEIVTLVNEEQPAGNYEVEFNVARDSRPAIASGIYFYKLQAGDFFETKKMILLK